MPKKHKKPSTEELNAGIKKATDEIDEEDSPNPEETPEEEVETPAEETPEEEPEEETPAEETPEEEEEETPPEEPKPPTEEETYKKRHSDSSREAMILHAKSKKIVGAIEKAGEIPEPTEEELKAEYPEWEEMTNLERKMAKDSLWNRKKLNTIAEVAKDFKDMEAWNKAIDDFLADPEVLIGHPTLENKEADFKIFASKESRRGVDFEDLVSAFLYEEEGKPKPKNKGKMFETGSGGIDQKPKVATGKISHEEGERLRLYNYKEYIRLLRKDKIELPEV